MKLTKGLFRNEYDKQKLTTTIGAHTATIAPALLLTAREAGLLLDLVTIIVFSCNFFGQTI